jgi:hypothetical protein
MKPFAFFIGLGISPRRLCLLLSINATVNVYVESSDAWGLLNHKTHSDTHRSL